MDSISISIAQLRGAIAEFMDGVRQRGTRIRVTRHGKPVAWIINQKEHGILERCLRNMRRRGREPNPQGSGEPNAER